MTMRRAKRRSGGPFETFIKRRLDYPELTCETCEAAITESPEPCALCPWRLLDWSDECARLTLQMYELLALNPIEGTAPPWEQLFAWLGVRSSAMKLEIYRRIGRWVQLQREHQKLEQEAKAHVIKNPQAR